MALRDLLASFTVNVDAKQLENVEKKFSQVLGGVQKFAGYLVTGLAGTAVGAFVKSQVDFADSLNDTSQKLGIATDDLERWQYVAALSGSSAEGMAASLGFLNKAIGQAGAGSKEASAEFSKLDVSLKNQDGSARELGDVLPDIVQNFNKLGSQGEKTTVAMALFGKSGQQLIPMLNAGGESASALIAEFERLGGATPQAFIDQSAKINDQMDRLHLATRRLSQTVVAYVLPAFQWLLDKSTSLISGLRDFEEKTHFAERAVKLLAAAVAGFLIFKLVQTVREAKSAGAAVKQLFGIGPQGMLIIAALLLLYVAFDDLMTLFQGGQSVIGDTLDELLGFGAAQQYVEDLKASFEDVKNSLSDLGITGESVLGALAGAGKLLLVVFAAVIQNVAGLIQIMAALVKAAVAVAKLAKASLMQEDPKSAENLAAMKDLFEAGSSVGKGIGTVAGAATLLPKAVYGMAAEGDKKSPQDIYTPSGAIPNMPARQLSSAERASRATSVTQSNAVTQNFYVDKDSIGGAVKDGLADAFKAQLKDTKALVGGT